MTSQGIRCRHNIGRSCLSGIIHFGLIIHFNEVSQLYNMGLWHQRLNCGIRIRANQQTQNCFFKVRIEKGTKEEKRLKVEGSTRGQEAGNQDRTQPYARSRGQGPIKNQKINDLIKRLGKLYSYECLGRRQRSGIHRVAWSSRRSRRKHEVQNSAPEGLT